MIDRTVKFPQIGDVSSTQSYVLVGANGSGKSHLGAWIEKIMIKFYVSFCRREFRGCRFMSFFLPVL